MASKWWSSDWTSESPIIERVIVTNAPFEIIAVTDGHLPALAELARDIWRAYYPSITSLEQIEYMLARMYSLETMRAELGSQDIRYYGLLADGRLAGFASIGPTPAAGVMKLHKLYLLPELHGRGLGSRLLRHCEAEARQSGARRLVLAVNKRNTKAIAAYERNGFAVEESVMLDIGGGFVMDDFIMAKDLCGP